MKLSRAGFLKRLVGGLAGIGFGGKVVAEARPKIDIKKVRAKLSSINRGGNNLCSDQTAKITRKFLESWEHELILTKGIDRDFEKYARGSQWGENSMIGDKIVIRRPYDYSKSTTKDA